MRVGIFGYSRALRPVLGEPHGGAPPYLSAVHRAPPPPEPHGPSLLCLPLWASCMLSALDKQLLDWNKKDVSSVFHHIDVL